MRFDRFFTLEDLKIAANLFCCIYGIGTLSMPTNFSRAGPVLAVLALLFTAAANVYASVVCSKVMLLAPRHVKTFGDLGEWCMGKKGRYIVVAAQMGVCLLLPCAFLVLGGILLTMLFPDAFGETTWIILMAIMVLPVCLTPTLKESAGVALAGCLGTLIADVIGVSVLLHGMAGHPSVPSPDISFEQVATAFGSLSLAYGAAVVIPTLQRQHNEPERMPRIVLITMGLTSILFLCLGSLGYSAIGCQISSNLLFSIYPDATTGMTSLGFTANKGAVIVAYLAMQLHISIAFNVALHPVFYILERMILGMHKKQQQQHAEVEEAEEISHFMAVETPQDVTVEAMDKQKHHHEEDSQNLSEYKQHLVQYICLRLTVVVLLVIASVLLQDHFLDLTDFIGASAITFGCIILPIAFYLKKMWTSVPMYEKIAAFVVIFVCFLLGCYATYTSGKNLFNPDDSSLDDPIFPFCHVEDQFKIYYQKTNVTGSG